MRVASGLSMVALALTLALGMSTTARAEDAKAVGTVSGKVVDAEGKAVKGATVMAVKPMEGRPGGGGGGGAGGGGGGGEKPGGGAGGGEGGRRQMPTPLAETKSGDDGSYKLENVPVGKVMIAANMQDVGRGRTQAPVEVTAGADTKADDIKLAKRPQNGGGRREGGRQGGGQGGEAKKDAPK